EPCHCGYARQRSKGVGDDGMFDLRSVGWASATVDAYLDPVRCEINDRERIHAGASSASPCLHSKQQLQRPASVRLARADMATKIRMQELARTQQAEVARTLRDALLFYWSKTMRMETMACAVTLRRTGGSITLSIPKSIAKAMAVDAGSVVELVVEGRT